MAKPKKTQTANELLLDALIRHQIYLMRLAGGVRQKIERLLRATEADLEAAIHRRLGNLGGGISDNISRAMVLQRIIKNMRAKSWDDITDVWVNEAVEISKAEPSMVAALIREVAPVVIELALPPIGLLKSLVTSRPFEGRTLRQWAQTLRNDDLRRIQSQIQMGVVSGETTPQIAKRIVGSARLRGSDGVTAITRRQAEAITRTAINSITNFGKQELYELNADILSEELFVATLDNRTTAVCRGNDGKIFPLGQGPIPPLHWNCRSLRVPVLDGQVLGERPFKSATETELLAEFADDRDLGRLKTRGDIPRGLRGAYDRFAQARVREMTGRVPATTTYNDWLKQQTVTFQEDVLGKTKAKLFRTGDLHLDQFINRQGDELTLADLASRHQAVFVAAGLNPQEFR
jgi:SPP1 gp7 family putative phage head morphogenesis protein